jgi:hypothetical protein
MSRFTRARKLCAAKDHSSSNRSPSYLTTSSSLNSPKRNFQAGATTKGCVPCTCPACARHCERFCHILSMYCLSRSIGRASGGSGRILDAMSVSVPGGSNVTLDYFWLSMLSLAWASHAAAVGPARAPSFGMMASDGSHGVIVPGANVMWFDNFMQLPQCAKLGAVLAFTR